jgi:hypothetical protein
MGLFKWCEWMSSIVWSSWGSFEIRVTSSATVGMSQEIGPICINQSATWTKMVVKKRIVTARRTVYSLMGAGLHGLNGVNPYVAIHMIQIYQVLLSLSLNTKITDFSSLIWYLNLFKWCEWMSSIVWSSWGSFEIRVTSSAIVGMPQKMGPIPYASLFDSPKKYPLKS